MSEPNMLIVVLTFFAALGSGLVAGLFFAFSVSVMTALDRLPPREGMAAMQYINVAILNPWFFAVFFGTALACIALAVFSLSDWSGPGAAYLLAGGALYLVGSILVTMAFNVPLNNALAAAKPDEGAQLWNRYLSTWTAWNHVRTAASLLASASFIMALY